MLPKNKNGISIIRELRALLIYIFIFTISHFNLYAQINSYQFESITNESGLSHNTVYDICQDKSGFMWFATDEGLNRYDGQNLKQYYSQNNATSLPSNTIPSIVYTIDNFLFAGTLKGLAHYQPETDNFQQILNEGKTLGEIVALQQGKGSEILISTESNGAFIYNYVKKSMRALNFFNQRIIGMTTDKEGYYWAFSRFAIFRFGKENRTLAEFYVSPNLFNSAISYMGSDSKGILWVGTFKSGLFQYNFKNNNFHALENLKSLNINYVRTIEEGEKENEYWIGTEKGLYVVNTSSGRAQQYQQSFDKNEKTLSDNAIYKVYHNKQNIYFVGTYFGGVNIAKTRNYGFQGTYPDDKPGSLHGKALSGIAKAPDGTLWIATEDAGIAIYDRKKETFRHLLSDDKNQNTISTNNVHALLMDGDICWAGHFMGGVSKINVRTGITKRFISNSSNPSSINNNFVFSICKISEDFLLFGTVSGIELFNKKTEQFSRFRENELNNTFVYDIFSAPDGKIWICTYSKGIFVLDNSRHDLMKHYQSGDSSNLPGNSVISHYVDSKKRIWVGTRGNGLCLFNPDKQKFTGFPTKGILPNNVIYGILEDEKSRLWISSNSGISRINFSDSSIANFNHRHGISGNQFNYKSYFKDRDGKMFFGSVTGLTSFFPEEIYFSNTKPVLYFSNFKIFNESIIPKKNSLLPLDIDYTNSIKLRYNQNSFTLEFSSINYYYSDIAFQYFLEGFDENWSPLSEKTQASYTNLSPGQYRLHIRAVNQISKIFGPERIIIISIASPLWATWYAYLIYFIILSTLIRYLYLNHQNRQKGKVALAVEKIEKENLNVLHQHKINFFTFISHEFKTPLSIILASVDMLTRNSSGDEIMESLKRSASKLLFLVNQLMDFRKIETDHAVINIHQGNLIDFIHQIIGVYSPWLKKSGIELKVNLNYVKSEIQFDFDKLEKILTNLLTNAVKYTSSGGNIIFSIQLSDEQLEFSVQDFGKGLNEIEKEKIFEVFYSNDSSKDLVESSGIGLALTSSLVKLLNGTIIVESETDHGCKFIVKFPITSKIDKAPIYDKQFTIQDVSQMINQAPIETELVSQEQWDFKGATLVIVEDNRDLLMLLQKYFQTKYKVKCFENGKNAWEYICEKMPDIVITDLMMPIMNGTELCHKIKSDSILSIIPVIILTAKTSPEAKLEVFQIGADAYISKPFVLEELDVRINNFLTTRQNLKKRFKDIVRYEGIEIPKTNQDQAFIENVFTMVHEHINKSELDVQFLANKLRISRSNLHNKIKLLMGMNTSEFINMVRIGKAKDFMVTKQLSLSEISYKVGYNDAAYFTRIFKKTTGLTPGEYRKSIGVK